jgi:hypothetical protein
VSAGGRGPRGSWTLLWRVSRYRVTREGVAGVLKAATARASEMKANRDRGVEIP